MYFIENTFKIAELLIMKTNKKLNISRLLILISTFFALLVVGLKPAHSASADRQYWTSIQASAKINSEWTFLAEYINRYSDDSKDWVVRSNRLGFAYKLENDWSYSLQVENRDTNSNANNEIRFINQLSKTFKQDQYDLGLRLRYEFREFNDSAAFQNRARLQGRIDFNSFKYGIFTPATSFEVFSILNEVTVSRPQGSTETRFQLGGTLELYNQKLDVFYLARQQYRPQNAGNSFRTSDYNVINLAYKLSFK